MIVKVKIGNKVYEKLTVEPFWIIKLSIVNVRIYTYCIKDKYQVVFDVIGNTKDDRFDLLCFDFKLDRSEDGFYDITEQLSEYLQLEDLVGL